MNFFGGQFFGGGFFGETRGGKRRRWVARSTDAFEQYESLSTEEDFLEDIELALSGDAEVVASVVVDEEAAREKHIKELSEAYQAYFESAKEALLFIRQRRLEIRTQTQAIALIIMLA